VALVRIELAKLELERRALSRSPLMVLDAWVCARAPAGTTS
jgi:hypothetical protein